MSAKRIETLQISYTPLQSLLVLISLRSSLYCGVYLLNSYFSTIFLKNYAVKSPAKTLNTCC